MCARRHCTLFLCLHLAERIPGSPCRLLHTFSKSIDELRAFACASILSVLVSKPWAPLHTTLIFDWRHETVDTWD